MKTFSTGSVGSVGFVDTDTMKIMRFQWTAHNEISNILSKKDSSRFLSGEYTHLSGDTGRIYNTKILPDGLVMVGEDITALIIEAMGG